MASAETKVSPMKPCVSSQRYWEQLLSCLNHSILITRYLQFVQKYYYSQNTENPSCPRRALICQRRRVPELAERVDLSC